MEIEFLVGAALGLAFQASLAAEFEPAPQHFRQEIAHHYAANEDAPAGPVTLLDCSGNGATRVFAAGEWYELKDGRWHVNPALNPGSDSQFTFAGSKALPAQAAIAWKGVRQLLRAGVTNLIAGAHACLACPDGGEPISLHWPENLTIWQMALSSDGVLHVGSSAGLWALRGKDWQQVQVLDAGGRAWAVRDVPGVAFDSKGRLWFATQGWCRLSYRRGLALLRGEGRLALERFYRHGRGSRGGGLVCYAPWGDSIRWGESGSTAKVHAGSRMTMSPRLQWMLNGTAWFATAAGVGCIERKPMTLAEKADSTSRRSSAISSARPMGTSLRRPCARPATRPPRIPRTVITTGCGLRCMAPASALLTAATKDRKAKERAKKAFEALRFLQKVTQGGEHCAAERLYRAHHPARGLAGPQRRPARSATARNSSTTNCGKSMSRAGPRAPTASGTGNPTPAATNWTATISSIRSTTICAPTRMRSASGFGKSCAM